MISFQKQIGHSCTVKNNNNKKRKYFFNLFLYSIILRSTMESGETYSF